MRTLTNNYYLEEVNRAIEFIESNVSDGIGLKEISTSSNLSKYHFHRVFKSIIGNTSKNYLTRLRLQKSSLLLKNTTEKIKDIAFDCGYILHQRPLIEHSKITFQLHLRNLEYQFMKKSKINK